MNSSDIEKLKSVLNTMGFNVGTIELHNSEDTNQCEDKVVCSHNMEELMSVVESALMGYEQAKFDLAENADKRMYYSWLGSVSQLGTMSGNFLVEIANGNIDKSKKFFKRLKAHLHDHIELLDSIAKDLNNEVAKKVIE